MKEKEGKNEIPPQAKVQTRHLDYAVRSTVRFLSANVVSFL